MFIRFHPKTFALKTLCVGALSLLTTILVEHILHQTLTPSHILLSLFYYVGIFLILFTIYSFRIVISAQEVTCIYAFQKKKLPLTALTLSTQYTYQGIPYPFPVHILKSGKVKVEIPYFVFGQDFYQIATYIHQAQRDQTIA